MPSSKEKIAAKKAAMTEDEKSLARKKDAMRKRADRAKRGIKKRKDMSPETLDKVREADRERWHIRQRSMTEEEREKVRESHRRSMAKRRSEGKITYKDPVKKEDSVKIEKKERAQIRQVLRRRKARLILSEEMKISERKKAKEGMTVFRKEGRLRIYMQRKKRGICEMKWKEFLAANPMFMALEDAKIEEMEEVKRQKEKKWVDLKKWDADMRWKKAMGYL